MGDHKEKEDEKKIPVFTVFKKDSILKNIYLDTPQTPEPNSTNQEEDEQIIVIGRHPDCSITLDHPSISRFHLRLHSKPSIQFLSLVDLSSVHGTWVSGKKVEPGVQVDLNEGDTVRLGGSSRLYMLHWVPMSRAYNLDDPFVPPMDVLMPVKETEELANQDESCCSSTETNQIQSLCTSAGDLDLSVSRKEIKVSPLATAMPECGNSSYDNYEEAEKGNLSKEEHKKNEISGIPSGQPLKEELIVKEIENQHSDKDKENLTNASSSSNDNKKDLFREEHEENEMSGFSSGTPLKESAVTKFQNQQSDEENDENSQALSGLVTGISYAKSPSGDHNKNLLRESTLTSGKLLNESVLEIENQQSDEEHENSQALDGVKSGMANVSSHTIDYNKHPLREELEENEISAFSSAQLLNESVVQIEYQQYDKEYEKSQALDEVLSDIADANSSPTIDQNEHPLREEFEENVISAFSSGQLLKNSVVEIEHQQYDEVCENSQALDGVLSGITDANSSPTIDRNEHPLWEENEISARSSGQLLSDSVVETEHQQYDEEYDYSQALDGVISGIEDANSSPTIDQNKHPLREEFKETVFSSGQLLNEPVVEIEYQQYDEVCENSQALSGLAYANSTSTIDHYEHRLLREDCEDNEISAFSSGQLLNKSVAEIENQQYDEDNEQSQAVNGVLSSVANAYSLCQNYHNKNLPEYVEIICASRMENGQEKMSTPSCHSPCSSTILESKDQLYLYEQDHDVEYSSSSKVHARQPLKNTLSKSEQESKPEFMKHSISGVCAVVGERSEALENKSSLKGDNEKKITVITRAPKMDLMNLSICCESISPEDCFEQLDEKNNTGETFATNVSEPKDTGVNTPLRSGQQSDPPRSIMGKPTSIDIQTGKQEGNCTGFTANTEVEQVYKENVDYESVSEALLSSVEVFAEEIFTPGKDNRAPNTLQQSSIKKTGTDEEINLSTPLCLSSPTRTSISRNFVQNEELIFSSDKENHTPKVLQKSKLVQPASKNPARLKVEPATKNRISRIPFRSLLSNSFGKSCSNDTTTRSINSGKFAQPIKENTLARDNKRWIMVADTKCLLNKGSRKALQLLQGVTGTQLIIPRVVIRELDCMKRRSYLFTRKTDISSALQWIEDCMINTNWWIHVESLMEEGRHLTPAPPLSRSEGENFAFTSAPLSAVSNFLEIVSPTSGDHILECALLNRKMNNDENLVIVSDDVSLKIKAMAEGMICETAEEFRESLANPFSDRFLWAKSSPRGLTWSCVDDIVLRKKYHRSPLKKPSKSGESLMGLKLILLHNSPFSGLIPKLT